MSVSFRYKPAGAETDQSPEVNLAKEFERDLAFLTPKEQLGILPVEPLPKAEPQPPPEEPKSSESALLRLADFIKKESKKVRIPETPEAQRAQKVISLYEKRLELRLKQQKGLQLNKAA